MQRLIFLVLLLLASLNAGCSNLLSELLPGDSPAPAVTPETAPAPNAPPAAAPVTAPVVEAPPPKPVEPGPVIEPITQPLPQAIPLPPDTPIVTGEIALLLPLNSPAFASAAEAVRDGFKAASRTSDGSNLPIRIYPTSDQVEDIVAAYKDAVQHGARLIVGPLTRNAVSALASGDFANVPTLALNTPENEQAGSGKLYLFSLSVEAESRQVAQLAFQKGARKAVSIAAATPLAKRIQQAFMDEWQKLGGEIIGQVPLPQWKESYGTLSASLAPFQADMYFLAADSEKSMLARPYLNQGIPIYATSQSFSGKPQQYKSGGLNDVHFVDMPWLVQPDHPAVMIYPHSTYPSPEMERLYALGIDAYRLGMFLLNNPVTGNYALDGVTGKITLKEGSLLFVRESTAAQFQQGKLIPESLPR